MGYLGFEPRTYRLKAEYSTIELVTLLVNIDYHNHDTSFSRFFQYSVSNSLIDSKTLFLR